MARSASEQKTEETEVKQKKQTANADNKKGCLPGRKKERKVLQTKSVLSATHTQSFGFGLTERDGQQDNNP